MKTGRHRRTVQCLHRHQVLCLALGYIVLGDLDAERACHKSCVFSSGSVTCVSSLEPLCSTWAPSQCDRMSCV